MATILSKAPVRILEVLSKATNDDHKRLTDHQVTVDVLMAESTKDGKSALSLHGYPAKAIARITPYRQRVQGMADAVIEVDAVAWDRLTYAEQVALFSHELAHLELCFTKKHNQLKTDALGRPKLELKAHDWQLGLPPPWPGSSGPASSSVTTTTPPPKARPIILSGPSVLATLAGTKTQTRRVVTSSSVPERCPYGKPGDRLWVRESWAIWEDAFLLSREHIGHSSIYKADYLDDPELHGIVAWKSPLFMPRWASRLILEITENPAEWLQEMTEADAIREGYANLDAYREYWDKLNAKRGHPWKSNDRVWVIGYKMLTQGRVD